LYGRRGGRPLTHQQRKFSTPQAAFRSGLEEKIDEQLTRAGVDHTFETMKLKYTVPEKVRAYTPDFIIPGKGPKGVIILESKGLFTTEDRQKMKLVKEQHPDLDIRFVFSNANARIAKRSPTTYAKWADTNGFPWAHRTIPPEWLKE
jgi:hypothetical protein